MNFFNKRLFAQCLTWSQLEIVEIARCAQSRNNDPVFLDVFFCRSPEEPPLFADAEHGILEHCWVYGLHPPVVVEDAQWCHLLVAGLDVRMEVVLDVEVSRTVDKISDLFIATVDNYRYNLYFYQVIISLLNPTSS